MRAPGVVIINEALAKQYWPKGDPLKDRLLIAPGAGPAFAEPARQIIGIVGDTRSCGTGSSARSDDVHADCADAGRDDGAELADCADVLDCAQQGGTAFAGEPDGGGPAGGERRPAGGAYSHDGRDRGAEHIAAAFQHADADDLRRIGTVDGGDRDLWADGVLGATADAGDGYSDGVGRAGLAHSQHGDPARAWCWR